MTKISLPLLLLLLTVTTSAYARVFYVAPDGDNANSGTLEAPLLTIQKAQEKVVAGDTVYLRGGTYIMAEAQIARYESIWAYVTYLDKSGVAGKRINYWAYPGEQPVFDYQHIKPADRRINAFQVMGSWLHFKGIEVIGVQVTITDHTQSICFENQGSNNIFEQLSMHDGQAIGFYLTRGSNNLILNCDAYRNHDYTSQTGRGGNVDGFGNHPRKGGVNNVFRGCRAWFNSDDGYDCINAHESTVFDNCWAFYNGYSAEFASLGDGNGFKVGGYGSSSFDRLPNPIPRNSTQFCLAVRNKASGFYANHHLAGGDWFNNSSYMNGVNYNMLNRKAVTPEDYLTDVPGYDHVMKNNLGFAARSTEVNNLDHEASDISSNYFTLPVTVTADDFISLEQSLLTAPRKPDGSLPDIDFMRLAPGSDLIDAGVDIGFPFFGEAPDLGYREHGMPEEPEEPETPEEPEEPEEEEGVLNVNPATSGAQVKVYPIPVHQVLNIEMVNQPSQLIKLNILSMQGKIMSSFLLTINEGVQLNLNHLSSGIYLLETSSPDEIISRTRFLKW